MEMQVIFDMNCMDKGIGQCKSDKLLGMVWNTCDVLLKNGDIYIYIKWCDWGCVVNR